MPEDGPVDLVDHQGVADEVQHVDPVERALDPRSSVKGAIGISDFQDDGSYLRVGADLVELLAHAKEEG